MADYVSKENLQNKSHKHNGKRKNRDVFFYYIPHKKQNLFHVSILLRARIRGAPELFSPALPGKIRPP
jgi:hypothetical protein